MKINRKEWFFVVLFLRIYSSGHNQLENLCGDDFQKKVIVGFTNN